MDAKTGKIRPEIVALLMHPVNLIKLNLKFAWNALESIRWALASGNERGAWRNLLGARIRLEKCEELILNNLSRVPNSSLQRFFDENCSIQREISFYAYGGIAEGLQSYRRALKMVFTI
jgi:hypothetical protein